METSLTDNIQPNIKVNINTISEDTNKRDLENITSYSFHVNSSIITWQTIIIIW